MSRVKPRWTPWLRCCGSTHGHVVRSQQHSCSSVTGREPTMSSATPVPVELMQAMVAAACMIGTRLVRGGSHPDFLWCLTLVQPDASICWLGASCTRVRFSNSMPRDGIWNSTSWREWWSSQLVSSRHAPQDEEGPSWHCTTYQSMDSTTNFGRCALASSTRGRVALSVVPCLSAHQRKCAFIGCSGGSGCSAALRLSDLLFCGHILWCLCLKKSLLHVGCTSAKASSEFNWSVNAMRILFGHNLL